MVPEYTVLTVISIVVVVAVELLWLRTGLFTRAQYWLSMIIVFFFQVLMDGWLTKLSAPIVLYAPGQFLGIRAPWDIPIEDFGFGWSMITLTLIIWLRLTRGRPVPRDQSDQTEPTEQIRTGRG